MTTEGLATIYPEEQAPLDPAAVDRYLTDIPPVDAFNAPQETIRSPEGTVSERLARVAEAIRLMETLRGLIAWHASVLREVLDISPHTIESLPEQQRTAVLELISRLRPDAEV